MSKKDEALKLARVAERVLKAWDDPQGMPALCEEMNCLREALTEQPAQQQEPYGWKVYGVNSLFMGEFAEADAKAEAKRIGGTCITFPLYTSPPTSKPWVWLTDEERNAIGRHHAYVDNIIRATEAKLKEKNT